MNPAYQLPVIETIELSWQKVKGAKSTLWAAYGWLGLIAFILGCLVAILNYFNLPWLNLICNLLKPIVSLIAVILGFGVLRLGVRRALDQSITASMVFYPLKHLSLILKLLGCWVLYNLLLLPFMCIIIFSLAIEFSGLIPGLSWGSLLAAFAAGFSFVLVVYLLVRTRVAWAFIVDQEIGPWQAIKLSFRITRHNFWRLVGLYFINTGIFFLSLLPLGLGLIWSLPYLLINFGMVYRKLQEGQNA